MKVIYVDNNATTQVAEEVFDAMRPFLTELYGNPSSMHFFGGQVARHITKAREQVAQLLGASPAEILFTSCGTESDNAAIKGTLESQPGKRHIVTTQVEHPAVLETCKHLEKSGIEISTVSVDGAGLLDLEELKSAIRHDTALISVMYANNETGVLCPVDEIAQIAKDRGIPFHCDAVQAVGKLPLDLSKTQIDLLALSGHKLHAAKGVGVLYVRAGLSLPPFIHGGHQESGRRAGTENVASIVGLGAACELARIHLEEERIRVKGLRDKLEAALLSSIPETYLNGDRGLRLPNTTNIGFKSIEGEAILLSLSRVGIAASSGSACTSGSLEPSHVLRAMKIPFTTLHGSVRFSLSRYNTEQEMDEIAAQMVTIAGRLRELSPFWNEANAPGSQGS